MKQAQLYKHDISRPLNPAVSVTDDSASTVKVEIEEYVFTDEILNGLYHILNAVRTRQVSHTGIWINGYYGSGKSHFLKYLNFCLSPVHRDQALSRMMDSVKDFDPLTNRDSKLEPTVADFQDLVLWLGKAEIDTVLFNIGDKVGNNTTSQTTFAKAIWEEFNGFRGFNKFNISLAQYLEKPLSDKGKLEEFKAVLKEQENQDWDTQAQILAITELDKVLEIASSLTPLSTDVIRKQIADNSIDPTPETLSLELKSYLAGKGENYRILFFIDEVSQFIGSNKQLLLQLQQIVTTLAGDCAKKAWVGCTAQQDLTEVLGAAHIAETSDDYGKILGRFETRIALQGTNTEYITQKRILDKDEDAIVELSKLYDQKAAALDAQFNLPTGYRKYANKQEFVDYYPFVPYQFQLIMNVFDAFVALQYVDTEVKGNERSVLKITHKTAQDHKEDPVGGFISFDMMFTSMFEAGLKHAGQRALRNADLIIKTYEDRPFGERVVKLLFMLSNISAPNKLLFPATLDNMVTLMMTEVDQSKLDLREKIVKVLEYLEQKSVVRKESKEGSADVYCFLTEEESEVNRLIMSQTVNNIAMSEALKTIFTKYITISNRESFGGNAFSVAMSIMDRNIIGQANANLLVEFRTDSNYQSPAQFAFSNDPKKMVYYLVDMYQADKKLQQDFWYYCKVLEYLKANASNASEQRSKTNNEFRQRASELLNRSIQPVFNRILDTCPIISGQQVLNPAVLGSKKATDRYKTAIAEHFKNVYPLASYIKSSNTPSTIESLKEKIRRPIGPEEYGPLNLMTEAEKEIENYLVRQSGDPTVADIITSFNQSPYGWSEIATVYWLNELVRRHLRAYSFSGNANVDKNVVADNILRERNRFTVTTAQKIDPQLVNDFIKAWKEIFNVFGKEFSLDSTELFSQCHNDGQSPLNSTPINLGKYSGNLKEKHASQLAAILDEAITKLTEWKAERDPEKFFRLIISEKEEGKVLMDRCKEVISFHENQLPLFSEIYAFARANKDNFEFITDEDGKQAVKELETIYDDPRPDQTLPKYRKRRDILRAKLTEIKAELVADVEKAYETVFDELEEFAQENDVTFDRGQFRNIPAVKTQTNNFFALQSNANVDAFKQQQMARIVEEAEKKKAQQGGGQGSASGGSQQKKPIKRSYVKASQICRAQKIRNIDELNNYVDGIRNKLIVALGDNDEIIVS